MPIHKILGPDGKVHKFEADEGVTEQEVIKAAEEQFNSAPEKTNLAERVTMGALDPVYGVGQVAPRIASAVTSLAGLAPNPVSEAYDRSAQRQDDAVKTREEKYQQDVNNKGMDWGRLAGNIVSPVNYLVPGGGTTTMGGTALRGAGYAVSMPMQNTDNFGFDKAEQIVVGAGGGMLGNYLGKVLNPKVSGDVSKLLNEGVNLTPGQITGGFLKSVEDKATSIPFVGDIVKKAQGRSIDTMNTAAINRSLSPIGQKLPKDLPSGRGAIQYAKETLGNAYESLLPKLTGKADSKFTGDLDNILKMAKDDFIMEAPQKSKFQEIIDGTIKNRISETGGITGQGIKDIESQIGKMAQEYSGGTVSEKQLSNALLEVQSSLRSMLVRANPEHAAELKNINTGYANFKRVENAASQKAAVDGVFTPSQLQQAVRSADGSVDKGAFARGEALMQDLSDPARSVLPNAIPNSGTVDRATIAALLFGGAPKALAGLGVPMLSSGAAAAAPYLMAPAALGAAYTGLGQKTVAALLTKRPDLIRKLGVGVTKSAPYLAAPAALASD